MRVVKPGNRSLPRLRVARIVAITVLAATFCGYLDHFTRTFDSLEQETYGERLEVAALGNSGPAQRARQRIALVTLSDSSFEGAEHGLPPGPFLPRSYHARLIRALTHYGAKVVAFDILFDTPQSDDMDLAGAVRASNRVLLACADKGAERPEIVRPEMLFLKAGARSGHTRVPMGPERPAIDRIAPVIAEQGKLVPAFSVEAVRMALGLADHPLRRTAQGWVVAGMPVPADTDGTFKIWYCSAAGETFPSIPYEKIVNATAEDNRFFQDNHFFENKIVLVGDTTRIHGDVHITPVGMMPGVEIQAHAIATLLGGKFLRAAPPSVEIALLVLLASIISLLFTVYRLRRAALFLVLLLPVFFLFNVWLFVEHGFYLHLVAPSATILFTAVGVLLERGLTEEQEKTRMRGLLHRYVSPQIAEHILQNPALLGRAGRRVTGTVLFSDIRGFTALSEQMPPEELVGRMNEYFQAMTDIVFRHEGTTASILGDALLALFGVPVPCPDHAKRAVAAAIEMQAALSALQERWRVQDQKVFNIGIGINTGEMVVGDVGGPHLMNFTVYGLQVNIASRVEGMNKALNSRILITDATYQFVAEEIEARGPLLVSVKGVEDKVQVYKVVGWRKKQGG